MILVVGQNAAWQKVYILSHVALGEVNRVEQSLAFASSKGPNVARALAGMGVQGLTVGYAGGAAGRMFLGDLAREGIPSRFTQIRAETRMCTTLAERGGASTEIIEPTPGTTAEEREEFRRVFLESVSSAEILVIAGTAVGGEPEDCYSVLVREARSRGIIVVLDSACRQARHALAEGPEILKINQKELGELAGLPVTGLAQRVVAYGELSRRHGIRWILASQGSEGIEGFGCGVLLHAKPPSVSVVNAIGSGDAASAGAAWAVHRSLAARGKEEILESRDCLSEALLTAVSMGTANCLNPINGKVVPSDYQEVRGKTVIRTIDLPEG